MVATIIRCVYDHCGSVGNREKNILVTWCRERMRQEETCKRSSNVSFRVSQACRDIYVCLVAQAWLGLSFGLSPYSPNRHCSSRYNYFQTVVQQWLDGLARH